MAVTLAKNIKPDGDRWLVSLGNLKAEILILNSDSTTVEDYTFSSLLNRPIWGTVLKTNDPKWTDQTGTSGLPSEANSEAGISVTEGNKSITVRDLSTLPGHSGNHIVIIFGQ